MGGSKLDADGRLTDAGRGRVEEEVAGVPFWTPREVRDEAAAAAMGRESEPGWPQPPCLRPPPAPGWLEPPLRAAGAPARAGMAGTGASAGVRACAGMSRWLQAPVPPLARRMSPRRFPRFRVYNETGIDQTNPQSNGHHRKFARSNGLRLNGRRGTMVSLLLEAGLVYRDVA
ncbi:unnamed protein product [Miscanthus lutarioriparius]|uniref:Uncharacterized protein n=1 Tax=Miscanthus lutarioriparius TaxID=422564 RepID=A0A811NQX8_9POAL|nr:unnamed protein product [Miscanthus lutarioriparius]